MNLKKERRKEPQKQLIEMGVKNADWLNCPFIKHCRVAINAGIDPGALVNKMKGKKSYLFTPEDLTKLEIIRKEIIENLSNY